MFKRALIESYKAYQQGDIDKSTKVIKELVKTEKFTQMDTNTKMDIFFEFREEIGHKEWSNMVMGWKL